MEDRPLIKNDVEFTAVRGTRPLNEALHVSGPYKVQDAPNAYSFERSNAIEINWKIVFEQAGISFPENNVGQLRNYILFSWDSISSAPPSEATIRANTFDLSDEWPAYVHDGDSIKNSLDTPTDHLTIFQGSLKSYREIAIALQTQDIRKGCVFRVPTEVGDRWYQPVIDQQTGQIYPTIQEFIDKWDDTWNLITGLAQVYYPGLMPVGDPEKQLAIEEAKKKARTCFPAVELIRADAATISRQYRNLMNEAELEQKLNEKATTIAELISTSPFEVIPVLTAQYRDLKNFGTRLDARKRQLADAAADLNYHLFVSDTVVTFYENNTGAPVTRVLKEGSLYVKSNRTASWVTYQTVSSESGGFLGIGRRRDTWQEAIQHSKTFDYYEAAIIDYDPWVEVLDFYKSKGYYTYLFRLSDSGLIAADGSTPAQILAQCQSDESFRIRCAIALPQRELTITGENFIVGYNLFIRPVPDIVVTKFPEICIRERLSYRFTWSGVALGDLAATIPLSPGEQREVTLSTSQKYESSRTETASSLIDITRLEKADFETVFEKEVRNESDTTTTFGASASGSYGGIVSGSANFSRTASTKDVARQLNRSVQKASQEVNRRSKEERTVTVSEKIETTQVNSTTFKVRNINEGSTLNIAFYRLYNSYQSLLKLDDFKYSVRSGRSILAGLDLVDEVVFSRDSLENMLDWLRAPGRFPFDINNLTEEEKIRVLAAIYAQVLEAYKEYPVDESESIIETTSSTLVNHTNRLTILQEGFRSISDNIDAAGFASTYSGFQRMVSKKLDEDDKLVGLPFWSERTDFAYDSGSLYCDVYVGQRPATEPYAENMRRLEEERVAGENRLLGSRARYLDAKSTKHLIGLGGVLDPKKIYVSERDVLYLEDGHVNLKLRLIPGILWDSGWSVVIKTSRGFEGGRFLQSKIVGGGILSFTLPRRFNDAGLDLASKDHAWFKDNVSVENVDMALSIPYRIS